jgi:hypothetical protein
MSNGALEAGRQWSTSSRVSAAEVSEPKRNAELVTTLFEPGHATPLRKYSKRTFGGSNRRDPNAKSRVPPNCPQTRHRGTKKASRENPKSLENMRCLLLFDV